MSRADDVAFRQACQRTIRALIGKHDWALVSEANLLELVLDAHPSVRATDNLERLIKNYYIAALHAACRQTEDLDRHERGYQELFRHLYRAAYNQWPDLAEDVTQQALLLVYEQIDRCREPVAFLAFALNKLRGAFQQIRRIEGNHLPLAGADQRSAVIDQAILGSPLFEQEALHILFDAIKRLPDKQRQTIVLKFFRGLNDEDISERVGVRVGHVRVLRHRSLAQLRNDLSLCEYFERQTAWKKRSKAARNV
jgi:RNA polymerase sigma-70 factor, ECF subfamily